MSDITWRQGRVDTSNGSVSYDMTSIATEKTGIPLGSYQFVLPHVSIQFKKVSNGTTTDVNYGNIKRYIFLYDENDVYLGYQQITNELYSFEASKFANARKFIFECYYGTAYNMYPSQPQVVTETTYYYMELCSFYFNVVRFHEVNDIWISVNAAPVEHEAIELPLPLSYWRIDSIHNEGYPWHERLGDVPVKEVNVEIYKSPIVYRIVANGKEIYASNNIDIHYGIINPVVTLEDSSTNSAQFQIPPDHYFYNEIKRLKTKCLVYRNDEIIFEGRVISENIDMYNRRDVLFEGALAYLNDTRQPQREYSYFTVIDIFNSILAVHNDKMVNDQDRVILPGVVNVDIDFPRTDNYWYTQYESTLEAIQNLAQACEAHIRVRTVNENGTIKRYLDMFKNITDVSKQKIIFGSNLEDFTRNYDMGELATVLLPLGKHKERDSDVGDVMIPGNPNGPMEEVDDGNTVAWREYGYHRADYKPVDKEWPRMLRLNTDDDVVNSEYWDPDYERFGSRVVPWRFPESGDEYFTYDYRVNWCENVKAGDVFYLEATLPGKSLVGDRELYFYTVRDADGRQLAAQAASDSDETHIDIHKAPEKKQDGTWTEDTRIKIEIPTNGATLAVSGCFHIHVGDTVYYPFNLYKQRKLPDDMEDYVTIEKCAAVEGEHEEGSLYLKAVPRDVTTYDQNGVPTTVTVDPFAEWGYIERTVEFDDVEDHDDLYTKAKKYLTEYQFDKMTIEVSAFDAKILGIDTDFINLYENVRCISPKHGLDKLFPVTKVTLNLNRPGNDKFSLNSERNQTLTQTNSSINSDLLNKISKAGEKSATLEAAKKNAYNLITNSNKGIVSLNQGDDGYIHSITISNDANWQADNNYWIWNQGGMAYVDANKRIVKVGMTNDGKVIANEVAANSVISSSSLTGALTVGGIDTSHGSIQVISPYSYSSATTWVALDIYSDNNSVDGNYGELVSYTEPRSSDGLSYFFKILNGKFKLGYGYFSDGEIDNVHDTLEVRSVAVDDGGGYEERPIIDANGNLDIHATETTRIWCTDLDLAVEGNIIAYKEGVRYRGISTNLTIGATTYKVINGILFEED
jgi:hypothetical protein